MKTSTPRRIVITGVSQGLGMALVEGLIPLGHTIHGCSRGEQALAKLRERFGPPNTFSLVDVSKDQAVKGWAEEVLKQGIPDLVINNAAVINENAPLWQVSAEDFDRVMAINVCGTANVIRHFLPAMIKQRSGVIVNLSSGWGRSTSAEVAPYCASKYAIEGLSGALAQELPQGMAAVPLNPGIINTPMLQSCFGTHASSYPTAKEWAKRAVPYILAIGPADNGRALTVP